MRKLVVRPEAEADIDAAAEFYASEEDVELGLRLYGAVDRTFEALARQPHQGSIQDWVSSRLRGCRRWSVEKLFGVYQVFYLVSDSAIDVVRVLHGARDLAPILG